jgi:hypothetical protein
MPSTSAASHKRSLPYVDHPEAERWQEGPVSRAYDNIITQDDARAHFVDSIHHNQYNGPVHHYSERVQPNETTLRGSCTRSEILQSLKFDETSDRFSTINTAYAKTCYWLREREEYKTWRNIAEVSKHNDFLWIKGKPGAGKSTLMKWAFQYAQKSHGDDALISFFFNARGGGLERSTEGMYRSLIAQMLEKVPKLQIVLDEQRQRDNWPVEVLSGLFREAVMLLGNDGLTCYIDALDECSEAEIRDMIEVFEELTESAIVESINFRVCFSSRHYPRISIDACLELVLEGQEGHEGDIAAYIQRKLKTSARSKSEMAVEIQKRASGIFLWVCLVVRILNEDVDRGDAGKIKTRLKEIPDGLDKLFQDIITRGTREDTHLIPTLQWIMFTQRPLTCRELYHVIIYTPNNGLGLVSEYERFSTENAENFLLNSTKGLAETTRGNQPKVQLSTSLYGTTLAPMASKLSPRISRKTFRGRRTSSLSSAASSSYRTKCTDVSLCLRLYQRQNLQKLRNCVLGRTKISRFWNTLSEMYFITRKVRVRIKSPSMILLRLSRLLPGHLCTTYTRDTKSADTPRLSLCLTYSPTEA